jgi:hypothetical protein
MINFDWSRIYMNLIVFFDNFRKNDSIFDKIYISNTKHVCDTNYIRL